MWEFQFLVDVSDPIMHFKIKNAWDLLWDEYY